MKRMIIFSVSALFLISPMRSFSQPLNFEKIFEDTNLLYSVQQTTDSGYILSGLVGGGSNAFATLIKTNSAGDTVWTKKYPSIDETDHYKTTAVQTSDGGYILASSVDNADNIDVFLTKTDAQGATVWENMYGDSEEDKSWDLEQTDDNGYLISTFNNTNHAHLIKIDSVGVIEWEWDFGPILSFDRKYQAVQTSDQGFAVVIKNSLFKLDGDGDSLWTKTLGNNYHLLQESENKSLVLAGRNILMKADSSGSEIWLEENLSVTPNVLRVTSDGGYVLGEGLLLKLDEEGTEEWRLDLDGTMYGLIQSSDDGYTFCGGELVSPFADMGWLVKTDQNGYYQSLVLYQPEDDEMIQFGVDYPIKWRQENVDQINITFSTNSGIDWEEIGSLIVAESGEYMWQVPFHLSDQCKIRVTAVDQPELYSENENPFSIISNQYDYIAVNQIKMWFSNDGDGSHHPYTDGQGLFWPGGVDATKGAVFEDGMVFVGMVNGEYYAGGNYRREGLQPGNILEDGSAANPDSSIFGVWKIRRDWGTYPPGPERDRLEHDYQNWPVELGAPWIDNNGDGIYDPEVDQPKLYGDETNWMVMNDLDTSRTQMLAGCDPMGLEIQSTIYGYDRQDALADVVFKRYKILNKNNNFVDNMALGYWSDTDLGDAGDDYMGCDSLLNLAYFYNASNSDAVYGSPPPAIGYMILQGPLLNGSPGDSAWFNGEWINGYRNLLMTSTMGHT